jgi:hypothetical protein
MDATNVRWPLSELRLWLNDALREITLIKPTAFSSSFVFLLSQGSYQRIPDAYISVLRVTTNLKDVSVAPRNPGRAIRAVSREMLDAQNPSWQDRAVNRPTREVRSVVYDDNEPLAFWVYPPNDGTGIVDVIATQVPAGVPAVVSPADPADINQYDVNLTDVSNIYSNTILDYMLYRAYSKDSQFAGSAQRAAAYYAQFSQSLGVNIQNERTINQNTKATPQQENRA